MKFAALFLLLLFLNVVKSEPIFGSVYYQESKYTFKAGVYDSDSVAYGVYDDQIEKVGNSFFHLVTNPKYGNNEQVYAAGYLEGALLNDRINYHLQNFVEWSLFNEFNKSSDWPNEVTDWFHGNINYVKGECESPKSDLIQQFCYTYLQMTAVYQGFIDHTKEATKFRFIDFYLLQASGDLEDVAVAVFLNSTNEKLRNWAKNRIYDLDDRDLHHHCTGFIKITDNNEDAFVSHNSWFDYIALTRVMKEYEINLKGAHTVATNLVFSSYPGVIFSLDDFYITNKKLVVFETTYTIQNHSIYQEYLHEKTFLTFLRTVSICRMSSNGEEYVNYMKQVNSGTYNNMYSIFDLKLFNKKSTELNQGLLWVLEMIPGFHSLNDQTTPWLIDQSYFPSFNRPMNKTLFVLAGYQHAVEQVGNYWSWNYTARRLILARNQSKVQTLDDMKALGRYNNYLKDPLCKLDPSGTIAARYDLKNTSKKGNPEVKAANGAIDLKVTDYEKALNMEFDVIVSPTKSGGLPAWEFGTKEWSHVPYHGLPKKWDYDWVTFRSRRTTNCKQYTTCKTCAQDLNCGWCDNECLMFPILKDNPNNVNSKCAKNSVKDWKFDKCSNEKSDNSDSYTAAIVMVSIAGVLLLASIGIVIFRLTQKKVDYKPIN
ncbi:phospholipase b-related [Anaeramoeba flamelloides]|uniref:Phospholipase B-like n=1 Tax=Anaeramoeba flamelloides TaxID=1746091 RepID=A0ABQ8ZDK1_9EUKA|nr:phospholipase b-related [Anaeramoeba flamelloides]